MTTVQHHLFGCAPRPLGAYLKGLAVLRIVSEQADPDARGAWSDGHFVLETTLGREELLDFFAERWEPSPFLSPWNKGSGLLSESDKAVLGLEKSTALRFDKIRAGIATVRKLTQENVRAVEAEKMLKARKTALKTKAEKDKLDADPEYQAELRKAAKLCKRLKDELQPECQRRFRGAAAGWLRAAMVLSADGTATFPALFGTGGNDGRLDFTNHALQRLGQLFELESPSGAARPEARKALGSALFGDVDKSLIPAPIGQYQPANAGGANATTGALGDSYVNPWDLPLLLEGALFFSASTSRRLGAAANERVVAPFSTRSLAAGFGSAALGDESARGEQWFPLWERPASAREIQALLIEGRSQLDRRPAENSLDMARAIARLGIARGISSFERYGYLERNGKSNYAVPLGRWEVRAEPRGALLDDLELQDWWPRLRRACRTERAPRSLVTLEHRLSDLALEALARGGDARRWQQVLRCLSNLESQLVASGAFTAKERLQPLPPLGPGWLEAVDDGSPELRLALTLALSGAAHDRDGRAIDSTRAHWLPLDRFGRFRVTEKALANEPRVVVTGLSAERDLVAIVQRRLIEARTPQAAASVGRASAFLPLVARKGFEARLEDLAVLVDGGVDSVRVLELARGLAALDPTRLSAHPSRARLDLDAFDPVWAAIRLAHERGLSDGRRFTLDPAIARSLSAGDLGRAYEIARLRLSAGGLRPALRVAGADPSRARRVAASLAFPISIRLADLMARELDPAGAEGAKETSRAS